MIEKKIIGVGDVLFLHQEDKEPIEYNILDSGVYIDQSGSYSPGFTIESKEDKPHFFPFWMFKELYSDGKLWKKGQEKVAEKLRKIREKQKEEKLAEAYRLAT